MKVKEAEMAVDLALDALTGDLIATANNDIKLNTGAETIAQRMRNRLRIPQGTWALDPTEQMGSRLSDAQRLPLDQALSAVPLYVKEALQQMDDIHVVSVHASLSQVDNTTIDFVVLYTVIGINEDESDPKSLSSSITVTG